VRGGSDASRGERHSNLQSKITREERDRLRQDRSARLKNEDQTDNSKTAPSSSFLTLRKKEVRREFSE